ncbi:MAG: hypothetical protein IPJ65_19940 [Archangiaceae bacterium]|nr:hypothetical protein [Archangiaceae bacterium]
MRRVTLLLGLLSLAACRDAGDEVLARTKSTYAELLQVGTPAQSRDFDAVLKALDSIPSSSHARAEADKLKHAIEAARAQPAQRPLAVAPAPLPDLGAPALQAELENTRVECATLAQRLSGLTGDARAQAMEVLDACRRRADELVDSIEHGKHPEGAPVDGGAP